MIVVENIGVVLRWGLKKVLGLGFRVGDGRLILQEETVWKKKKEVLGFSDWAF